MLRHIVARLFSLLITPAALLMLYASHWRRALPRAAREQRRRAAALQEAAWRAMRYGDKMRETCELMIR